MVKIFDKIRYKKFKTKNEFKETIDENIVVNDDLDSGWSYGFGISINKLHEIVVMVIHSQIYRESGIKLGLLLTTGLIPAGLLAFILNATLPKK